MAAGSGSRAHPAHHYSIRTEQAYVEWVRRFILFHGKRHPRETGAAEVEAFLSHLAVQRNVAANTQNQALAALLFLYKDVMGLDLPWLDSVTRAKRPKRLPTVLTRNEVQRLLERVEGSRDQRSGAERRHHMDEQRVQRHVRQAAIGSAASNPRRCWHNG